MALWTWSVRSATAAVAKVLASRRASSGVFPLAVTATMLLCATGCTEIFLSRSCALSLRLSCCLTLAATSVLLTN